MGGDAVELLSLKCPYPNCTSVVVLELLEEGESARFFKVGRKVSGQADLVTIDCPEGHNFKVAFRSIHRTQFQD